MKNLFILTSFIVAFAFIFGGCGQSNATKSLTAEERFEISKKMYDDEDYLEAINEFEIIKLQYPGSSVADDAQYYLAESRFNLEEYLLAAMEYQELRRNFSSSSFVPQAQYKIALCYYMLAPRSSLDQKYTLKAIDELQAFIEYNPTSEQVAEAAAKIKELNSRIAKKLYDTAELYMILEYYKSATIYYTDVIEKYHDTEYAELSLLGRIKSFIARKKYSDARKDLSKYFEKYPQSPSKKDAEALQRDVDNNNS